MIQVLRIVFPQNSCNFLTLILSLPYGFLGNKDKGYS